MTKNLLFCLFYCFFCTLIEILNVSEVCFRNLCHRQSGSLPGHFHSSKFRIRFQFWECDWCLKFLHKFHRSRDPDRVFKCRLRIIVFIMDIQCGHVWESITHDSHESDNSRLATATVIKETQIPYPHIISEDISGLKVPHTSPGFCVFFLQIINTETTRLGFKEEIVHNFIYQLHGNWNTNSSNSSSITRHSRWGFGWSYSGGRGYQQIHTWAPW